MICLGGVVEANNERKCHSNELYYYNIICNTWVSSSLINSTSVPPTLSNYPRAGRFSHSAVLRDDQTMLVVAGFSGVMRGDVVAYRFPQAVALKNAKNMIEQGAHCQVHTEKSKQVKLITYILTCIHIYVLFVIVGQ